MYGAQDPGNWMAYQKRQDNTGLSLMEVKTKFLKETIDFDNMVSFQAQSHVAGIASNPLVSLAFDAAVLQTITGFTSQITAVFTNPVTVVGSPQLIVNNSEVGGGSSSTVVFGYEAGSGTNTLAFQYLQGASATNTGVIAANMISVGTELVGAGGTVVNPTGTVVDNDYSIDGTGYTTSGAGTGATFAITVSGGVIDSVTPTVAGEAFIPDEIITFNDAVFGAGSLGGSISVDTSALTGDVISTPRAFTYLGDAAINNVSDSRPIPFPVLPVVTKTAVAS